MTSKPPPIPLVCHLCRRPPKERAGDLCAKHDLVLIDPAEHKKDPVDPFLGRTVGGRYPIVGIVGSGGMGRVYRAIQQPVGREVALKVIRNTGDDRLQVQGRFEREARVVARLRHANTVTLHDFGVHDDGSTLFMVLEMLDGVTLHTRMGQGPMPPDEACKVVASVLDALVEAHALGLVHRDIKPDNIMLVPNPWGTTTVKVLDFGIAKALGSDGTSAERLTATGAVFGTLRYMSPEQTHGKDVDARADLYALGVVLYEALTGRHPFESDDPVGMIMGHRTQAPPPLAPDAVVDDAVRDVVLQALAKAPAERFDSAASMARALRAAAGLGSADDSADIVLGDAGVEAAAMAGEAPAAVRPFGGTSREMAAEMMGLDPSPGRVGVRVPVAAAAIAAVVGGLTLAWWIVSDRAGASKNQGVVVRETPTATGAGAVSAAAARPSPKDRAKASVLTALRRRADGDAAGALAALREAAAADPRHAEAHYVRAAILGSQADAAGVVEALDAYLGLQPDPAALATQLREDEDFSKVRSRGMFVRWAKERGLPGLGASRPTASPAKVSKGSKQARPAPRRTRRPKRKKATRFGIDPDL